MCTSATLSEGQGERLLTMILDGLGGGPVGAGRAG
jgi:hypothetical protein